MESNSCITFEVSEKLSQMSVQDSEHRAKTEPSLSVASENYAKAESSLPVVHEPLAKAELVVQAPVAPKLERPSTHHQEMDVRGKAITSVPKR